ncbi:hypothetical protein EK904_002470, partial [Melospiza melodia maxima]
MPQVMLNIYLPNGVIPSISKPAVVGGSAVLWIMLIITAVFQTTLSWINFAVEKFSVVYQNFCHGQLKRQNTCLPLPQWWKMMVSCEQLGLFLEIAILFPEFYLTVFIRFYQRIQDLLSVLLAKKKKKTTNILRGLKDYFLTFFIIPNVIEAGAGGKGAEGRA